MKHPIKTRIYLIATTIYDWHIPGLTWLMDKIRYSKYIWNEDLYDDLLRIRL